MLVVPLTLMLSHGVGRNEVKLVSPELVAGDVDGGTTADIECVAMLWCAVSVRHRWFSIPVGKITGCVVAATRYVSSLTFPFMVIVGGGTHEKISSSVNGITLQSLEYSSLEVECSSDFQPLGHQIAYPDSRQDFQRHYGIRWCILR